MLVIGGPFAVVAGVLAVSGVLKLADPAPATQSWRVLPTRLRPAAGVVVAGAEVALAMLALTVTQRGIALAMGLLYGMFAALSVRRLRTRGTASCGCFGRLATPPSWLHVASNVLSAGVASLAAIAGTPPLTKILATQSVGQGVLTLSLAALAAGLAIATVTTLPATRAAARAHIHTGDIPIFRMTASARTDNRVR